MFYKYCEKVRTEFFDDLKVRFSQLSVLNDPYESVGMVDSSAFAEQLRRNEHQKFDKLWASIPIDKRRPDHAQALIEKKAATDDLIAEILSPNETGRRLKQIFDQTAGVFCVTISPHNLLMWSHYASNHLGYVIGMDADHPFFTTRHSGIAPGIKKVSYQEKPSLCKPSDGPQKSLEKLLYEKSPVWKYEDEYRLVLEFRKADDGVREKIEKNTTYLDLVELPQNLIKEIYIGAGASSELEHKALAMVAERGMNTKIFKMRIKSDEYGLAPVALN